MGINENKKEISEGLRDGLPIGMGYFAVAFSLGITAKLAGLSPFQGFVSSFLNHASAGEYALYTMIRTESGKKPAFQIIFNDSAFLAAQCKSLYVDPCITFAGGSNSYELKGNDPFNFKVFSRKDEIGSLVTERQANNDPKYILTIDDKYYDDYFPLFAVVADKCFSGKNK